MKQKTKFALLAGLILVAAVVFYFDHKGISFPGKSSPFRSKMYAPLPVENPQLQRGKLEASRRAKCKASGRDLSSEALPAPPPPKVADKPPAPVLQLPVEPPP